MKKLLILGVISCILVSGIWAYLSMVNPRKPVRLGYIGSLSGKFSAMGTAARNGAILAVEELNGGGGIHGRRIELVIKDDGGLPDNIGSISDALADEDVGLVIGPFTTASATMMVPRINEERILAVGPVVAGDNIGGLDDMFIKIFPSTADFGKAVARLAIRQGIRSLVIINDRRNEPFGETMIRGFKPVYASGGGTVRAGIDYLSDKEANFTQLAKEAAEKAPAGVLIIASAVDTALISQHIKKLLPEILLYASPWSMSKELVSSGGEAVESLYAYLPYDKDSIRPAFKRFQAAYVERFKEAPPFVSMFNYEAVYLLAEGIKASHSTDPVKVKQTLLKIRRFNGLQSDYALDESGDAERPLFLYRISGQAISKVRDGVQ
ncbi:MAG: ABC transporter substrate-binding protein [Desulfobacterales bacterium]|nr:ABC transporter substrate-binding protein [Desulfobacterales bacterium]